MYRIRLFLAHILFKMAEIVRPKQYPKEIELKIAQQQNLRASRMARLKGPK
jgi:hypothetical protein